MIVEKDCKYISGGVEYSEGQKIAEVKTGDIYVCGDYEYKYNYKASLLQDFPWIKNESQSGWGVRVLDKTKKEYGTITNDINGKPVTSLHNTFYVCVHMYKAPEIPHTIVDLWGTFSGCESLACPPTIPNNVQKMQWAFEYCENLKEIPKIPEHITDLTGTFADCILLEDIKLPTHVTTKIEKVFINHPLTRKAAH